MNQVTDSIKNIIPKKMQDIYPTSKLGKTLYSIPMLTWRLGLGPLIGRYILIITHIGRKTGNPHQTAVEYHTINKMKYIPCAFGIKSDWYRNILANPHVTIQTSDGSEAMIAMRVTDNDELMTVIETLLRKDPPLMNWYLDSLGILPTRKEIIANKEKIFFLRFDPTSEAVPHGLEVDLAWIWPVFLFWIFISRPFRKRR